MNCYPIILRHIRTATRPLRHHFRKHLAFHITSALSIACVGGPTALLFLLPPNTVEVATGPTSIPEPTTWIMLGFPALSLLILRQYRNRP